MQTISSLVERLDMTPEQAVEVLRYMLFDVDGVETEIGDDECDLLIDVDDDPAIADRVRKEKLAEIEKKKKRTERLKAAGKKAAAKRKAEAKKKAAAKKEAAPKKKAAAKKKTAAKKKAADEGDEQEAPPKKKSATKKKAAAKKKTAAKEKTVAEILPAEEKTEVSEAAEAEKAEILPAEKAESPSEPEKEEEAKPSIVIGTEIEHDADAVQVTRADGTAVEPPDVEIDEVSAAEETEPDEEETGLLAEAERRQEEEEKRKAKEARPAVKPDPAVVAEVKRKAAERKQRMGGRAATTPAKTAAGPGGAGGRRTGKTARKRQKRAERMRSEEAKRREAAAAVREITAGGPSAGRKRRKKRRDQEVDAEAAQTVTPTVLEVEDTMTVEELAQAFDEPVNDLILDLMDEEVLATKNQTLSIDVIRKLAEARDFEVRMAIPGEEDIMYEEPDDPADLVPRAPVVTVMGHVDHGKTTLLDRLRAANVVDGEAGGITQHIAAYDVKVGDARVTFLDTPGHEAFTQMRSRGAQVTDVVVLVVAADDGVMPQTVEAIDHAKAAEVPIVVAVNKCDKPDAQPERIRQELTRYELVDEKWGGQTIVREISAKTGDGIDDLMELLVLESEMLELKANPNKPARAAVVESEISTGQGPVAWVLVQNGTLHVGDAFLAGETHGRVRSMMDSRGKNIQEAGPATPVLVTGFNDLANAGDQFIAVPEERVARSIAEQRAERARQRAGGVKRAITLEDLQEQLMSGEKNELNVVLKADVQGSVDVLQSSLAKLGNENVRVKLVHSGVGGVNESDVILASASDAVIIGFHVTANARVKKEAEKEGVDIRTYRVIYEAIEDVRRALEGLLEPEKKEVVTGHAEIRAVFRASALGNIAGCYVQDGEIERGASARLIRDDVILIETKINSLRREKDDVRSVSSGYECGIKLENYEDIKEGDIIETYRIESIAATLA